MLTINQNKAKYVLEAFIDPPILPGHDYLFFYANLASKEQDETILKLLNNKGFDVICPFVFEQETMNEYKEEEFLQDFNNAKLQTCLKLDNNYVNMCFFRSDSDEMIKWAATKLPLLEGHIDNLGFYVPSVPLQISNAFNTTQKENK